MTGLARSWNLLLDIIYPPRCGGCDRRGTLMCADCLAEIVPIVPGLYSIDGADALICAGVFAGPLRNAVHKLKYEGDTPLARALARLLSGALEADGRWVAEDGASPVLVAVPLHPAKKRARGYNQSELLALELGKLTGWPVVRGLERIKNTRSQVGLSANERADNVSEAFEWRGGDVPERVLLVDDVCTTGATLTACALALRARGCGHVYAVTVAKALGDTISADI
ncbi:MAG TPA: ComF family protein [Chloroflexia bacterium]|nr:ComF family protein [Chloroflexia bacterium]